NRGSAYFRLGKRDLAMKDYAKGLEIEPDDADLYYNRGLLHLSEGRKAEARADFSKATALRDRPSAEPSEKVTDVPPPGPGAK
ncbi:MAG: tetratricopeptide repeat protein, partial [Candidatus Desulfacyla sp.]